MSALVTIADAGHVRTITLNRAEKKNALSQALAWGVIEAVDAAAADDNVWVVAITGSGDAFCAGLDLSPGAEPYSPYGVAVGAGLGLAMATDVRLIASSARLMAGYTRIGGSPDAGLTITLPQAMGYERAMRFMMENRTLTGAEAVAWGMAGEAVDDAGFAERLAAYCQELCAWSPITLRLLKRGIVKSYESHDMEQQLRYEVGNIRRAFASEDGQEARRAFLEKRKPVFQGR
jgi:2-(1,2-epoxy-1,2-dihydrophenyl)acetyl-CoA isomerase